MSVPPCASPFSDRVIIVLGTVRSGTTWLVAMLGAHPDIGTTTGESWLFHSLWPLWLNVHSPVEGLSAYLDKAHVISAMRGYCDGIFGDAIARHAPDASWFVEKTPGHTDRLALMAATHPDAWYVHLVRDGRDVSRSLLQAPWGHIEGGEAAASWAWGVRSVLDNSWRFERFRQVRYEDVLADPVGEVGQLLRWMGHDVDASVEERLRERAAEEVSRYGATDPVGCGKWRDLPPHALERIYDEAGQELMELGYLSQPLPSEASASPGRWSPAAGHASYPYRRWR